MKPSIFIMTKYKLINLNEFSNDQIYLDKLDNRFIDKEELKEKINKYNQKKYNGNRNVDFEAGFNCAKKEILKLLEE